MSTETETKNDDYGMKHLKPENIAFIRDFMPVWHEKAKNEFYPFNNLTDEIVEAMRAVLDSAVSSSTLDMTNKVMALVEKHVIRRPNFYDPDIKKRTRNAIDDQYDPFFAGSSLSACIWVIPEMLDYLKKESQRA